MPLNLTWEDLAFSGTKGYPGQVKRRSLPFQVEAALKYLVVPLTFAHDCTYRAVCGTGPGAHPRGGPWPSPWDLPSTRLSWFLPFNYVICISAACVRQIFALCRDRGSLQHGSELTLG